MEVSPLNFNILLFALLFFLNGCGVKAKPLRPPETAIQSYIESYTQLQDEPEKAVVPPIQTEKKK